MAQWLNTLGTLEEDLDLVSSAQVITSCNSNSRSSDTLFQPSRAPVCMWCTYRQAHKLKKEKEILQTISEVVLCATPSAYIMSTFKLGVVNTRKMRWNYYLQIVDHMSEEPPQNRKLELTVVVYTLERHPWECTLERQKQAPSLSSRSI